jgi:hypothetical protein
LQTEATLLRQLLSYRAGGEPGLATLTGAKASFGGERWLLVDGAIRFALSEDWQRTLAYRVGAPGGPARYALRNLPVRRTISARQGRGHRRQGPAGLAAAITADQDLFEVTNELAGRTNERTTTLIAANEARTRRRATSSSGRGGQRGARARPRPDLSWSLIGPIQSTGRDSQRSLRATSPVASTYQPRRARLVARM